MPKLRKELQKFKITAGERPFLISPDLVHLFQDLGEGSYASLILSIIVQRIAYMTSKSRLNLTMQEFFDLFPFVETRYLRKSIYVLRRYDIWNNKLYRPHTNMVTYTDIRINWQTIAILAAKVKRGKKTQ